MWVKRGDQFLRFGYMLLWLLAAVIGRKLVQVKIAFIASPLLNRQHFRGS